ncbi:MAG: sortase [Acidimicrobiia bacterium]|nr:sortase [Acidimicrobiia bacterium]
MKTLRILGWTMIWAGGLILAFLAYQLVGTNLIASRAQEAAADEVAARFTSVRDQLLEEGDFPPAVVLDDDDATTHGTFVVPPAPVLFEEPMPEEGQAFGIISIPKIELEHVLMEGVGRETLKDGPGHMPWTPLPGQPGNAVISGHRTTYGAPFYDLDLLEPGDEIVVETALGDHVFAIREVLIVLPTDVWVTNPKRGAWITLTTCNPRFSARERLVIQAELIDGPNLPYAQAQVDEFLEPMS